MSEDIHIDPVKLRRVEKQPDTQERCQLCGVIKHRGACPGCSGSPAAARRIQQLREELRANAGDST